ncbi:hypothetical protein BS47DRAFT_1481655 [Hydnum rufescens UP504]|uniref:CCL2-like lectin domain-containing protein n=1 Tax=Hydnum rufescens UP504 TaxID=1448309 RepID=A0A9P6B953_9AGAM|nr:hypothetical protein BS47DRAFT_1481655 [Hydnum rufescens UP504]
MAAPYVILSRVLSANREELAVQYNAAGNFTLEVFDWDNVPNTQRWVLNLPPPAITPVIPVPAADRQAAPGGDGDAFIQGLQLIGPSLWTVDVPGALNLFRIQRAGGTAWGSGAAEPGVDVTLAAQGPNTAGQRWNLVGHL